jgi:Uma2 family endonuclease
MAVATHLFPVHVRAASEEQRVLLMNVPWATYVVLRDSLDSSGVRMTYLEGTLEIMNPSKGHEVSKTQIARLLELFCLEREIPLYGFGSTTFRKEEQERGLEPDECYSRGRDTDVPDVAIEIIVSHGSIDKLEVYRGLGVREVWLFESGAFRVLALKDGRTPRSRPATSSPRSTSRALPTTQQWLTSTLRSGRFARSSAAPIAACSPRNGGTIDMHSA